MWNMVVFKIEYDENSQYTAVFLLIFGATDRRTNDNLLESPHTDVSLKVSRFFT